jgi:hypothetical protein
VRAAFLYAGSNNSSHIPWVSVGIAKMVQILGRQGIVGLVSRDELDLGAVGELDVLVTDAVVVRRSWLEREAKLAVGVNRGVDHSTFR